MDDIVERLRAIGDELSEDYYPTVYAAAHEIERLRVAGDALVAAIRNHDLREKHIKAWETHRG